MTHKQFPAFDFTRVNAKGTCGNVKQPLEREALVKKMILL